MAVGGSLRFATAPGQGTTFELFLPMATHRPEPSPQNHASADDAATPATILVVEDQPQLGDLMTKILEGAGHQVLAAPDGATALKLADRRHLDLVITDVAMPQMSGPQLVESLRLARPDLPAIYTSGYTGDSLPVDNLSRFLPKPFSIDQLIDATREALDCTTW